MVTCIWTDLSTFDVEQARRFYGRLMHWSFHAMDDGSGYSIGSSGNREVAGIYEMPAFFQKIRMPSFWMTYFKVEDIDRVVEKARTLGAKVELEEESLSGRIALIRDPAGAGFTCYEGEKLNSPPQIGMAGQWGGSELFVSDLNRVSGFYAELFGWSFKPESGNRYAVEDERGQHVAYLQVAPNSEKGEKEYWAVRLTVSDLSAAKRLIIAEGGKVLITYENESGTHVVAEDPQGAGILVSEADTKRSGPEIYPPKLEGRIKWRAITGLVMVYTILATKAEWAWGIFFLMWVLPDLKYGTTHFMEPISKQEHPILYWAVMVTWILLSVAILSMVFI